SAIPPATPSASTTTGRTDVRMRATAGVVTTVLMLPLLAACAQPEAGGVPARSTAGAPIAATGGGSSSRGAVGTPSPSLPAARPSAELVQARLRPGHRREPDPEPVRGLGRVHPRVRVPAVPGPVPAHAGHGPSR